MPNILEKRFYNKKRHYQKLIEDNHFYCDNVNFPKEFEERKVIPKAKKKKVKKKKGNLLVKIILFSLLFLYGYYVCPYLYNNFLRPVILNRILNRNIKINITSDMMYPTRSYLHNSFFMDKYLFVSPALNLRNLNQIQTSGELTETKDKLLEMFKNYPNLKPSVYVWEYSSGKGFEINADEIYPSASIIKIPIVFELIRLIDASDKSKNPVSLTDKMVFSEEFRTEGSGILKKTKADTEYSLDYLANIMIAESDNSATNMLLYKIGGMNGFNKFTRNIGLKTTSIGQWLPDIEGYNKTTAREISTLLYNIDNPNLINPKYKNIIKEYLGNTKNTHLLKEKLPKDIIILHKTGNIGSMLGDSGIIYTQNGKKYIVTIMVKRPHNNPSAATLIQDASLLIYNDIDSL